MRRAKYLIFALVVPCLAQTQQYPATYPPNGAAGGALTGSYPNPTLLNLTTTGAVPYVSSTGILNQDQTANQQFFWDSVNHRLGVGTTTPLGPLHVAGPNARLDTYFDAPLANAAAINFAAAGVTKYTVYRPASTSDLVFDSNAVANVLYLTNGGNVGVGTTAPGALFAVGASAQFQVNSAGLILKHNNEATAGNGVATVRGSASATAQGASITTTNLITTPAAGLYRVSAYIATSTAGTGNVLVTVNWTDAVGAKTLNVIPATNLTAGNFAQATAVVQIASGSLTYATTWTTSGQYNIYITAERLQ